VSGGNPGLGATGGVIAAISERERLVAAFTKAAAERGYQGIDVDQVACYAGLSRDRLELHFSSAERGLVAAQDAFVEALWLETLAGCEVAEEWPQGVRAGLTALIGAVIDASALARVFTVEAVASSLAAAERHFAAIDRFAALLREGRRHYPQADSLPPATERMLIGGVASIICDHLLAENPVAISRLEPQLVELLLIPYVGEDEARRISAG
jgi:AcrR family transcriptional regulator